MRWRSPASANSGYSLAKVHQRRGGAATVENRGRQADAAVGNTSARDSTECTQRRYETTADRRDQDRAGSEMRREVGAEEIRNLQVVPGENGNSFVHCLASLTLQASVDETLRNRIAEAEASFM